MERKDNPSHAYNSGRIHRAGTGRPAQAPPPGQPVPPPPKQPASAAGNISWDDGYQPPAVQRQARAARPSPQQRAPAYDPGDEYASPYVDNAPPANGPGRAYSSPYVDETPPPRRQQPPAQDWDDQYLPPQNGAKARGGKAKPAPQQGKAANAKAKKQGKGQKEDNDPYLPPVDGKKKKRRKAVVALIAVLCLLSVTVFAAMNYAGNILDPGVFGKIIPSLGEPKAYNKKDVVHILIIGIDYEEGRQYADGLGLTDMILYCRYDLKNNKLNMLQIPRDSYVGEEGTGGSGKMNALLMNGADKSNPINNIAQSITQQFNLPLDHYVAMDMDALKTIVNTFGGIRVYVPQTMDYGGSHLDQGWQWLDGDAAEFFVRNRKGEGFARGDIDRLDNQRHFYSALFRRFLNLTPKDVMNLLPVFDHYCNTDIKLSDMVGIGVAGLNLPSENVMFCKVPGATGEGLDPSGAGRSLYIIDLYGRGTEEEPGLANLLNTYFRDPEHPVAAEELGLPQIQIPGNVVLYPPNVQGMAEVQDPEGGAGVEVEPGQVA